MLPAAKDLSILTPICSLCFCHEQQRGTQSQPEELPDNEPAPEAEAEEAEEVPENPTPFALNPGQAHLKLLDYRTREGVKYYQRHGHVVQGVALRR